MSVKVVLLRDCVAQSLVFVDEFDRATEHDIVSSQGRLLLILRNVIVLLHRHLVELSDDLLRFVV